VARSPRLLLVVALATVMLLGLTSAASASPGALDASFDGDGIAMTPIGTVDQAFAMAIDGSGRMVLAGFAFTTPTKKDFALARYNADGTLDTTFSVDGRVMLGFGSGTDDEAFDVVVDSAGRIVVAGASTNGSGTDFAIARLLADGSPDTSFDGDGLVTTDFAGGSDVANGVAITLGDGIVAAGSAFTGVGSDFALARYGSTGVLDSAFDGDGKVTTDFVGADDAAAAVQIDAQGKYVVGGSAYNGTNKDEFAIARYDAAGALDPSFDADGKVVTTGNDQGRDLAIDAGGRIILAGSAFTGTTLDFSIMRFNTDGSRDATFGKRGRVVTPIGTGSDAAEAVAIDAGGTIVAAGSAKFGEDRDFALARYTPAGAPLGVFGSAGTVTTNLGASDSGRDVAFDADGNVALAGYATMGANADFTALRYLGSGYRGDAMIKLPTDLAYTGDDVYNTTGLGQMRTAKGKLGTSVPFSYRVQNEGTESDSFTLSGCGDSAGFGVTYSEGTTDITTDVRAGTYSLGPVPVGGAAAINVKIAVDPSATIGAAKTCRIISTSAADPAVKDASKAKVKVVS
jgi:uncharacterized delta-60 repeat protein